MGVKSKTPQGTLLRINMVYQNNVKHLKYEYTKEIVTVCAREQKHKYTNMAFHDFSHSLSKTI